ncbi:MAG: HU family DNA-binding protein [Solirubrobacteraceae bacterium]
MALTQTQFVTAVADRAQLSKNDAKRVLAVLDEAVLDELGNARKVRIGALVQLTLRVLPAQKDRKGRNPATGEEITIALELASVDPAADAGEGSAAVGADRRRAAGSLHEQVPAAGRLAVAW